MVSTQAEGTPDRLENPVRCRLELPYIRTTSDRSTPGHLVRAVRRTRRTDSRALRLGFEVTASAAFPATWLESASSFAVERRPLEQVAAVSTSGLARCLGDLRRSRDTTSFSLHVDIELSFALVYERAVVRRVVCSRRAR